VAFVSRFGFRAVVATQAPGNVCWEAARQVLEIERAKPWVEGAAIKGRVGSFLKTRIIGGAFVPESWIPMDVTVSVVDLGDQRQVVIDVGEAVGFGVLLGMEGKTRHRCETLAGETQSLVLQRLPGSMPLAAMAPPA
jgi:hypothetical protein